jgi:hypothetical protein
VKELDGLFKKTKEKYDQGFAPLDRLSDLTRHALGLLAKAEPVKLPSLSAGKKQYWVLKAGQSLSRPFLPPLLIRKEADFESAWTRLEEALDGGSRRINLDAEEVNSTLYTVVMAFCLCYDLWKPKSRKTPGTQFEVVLGSLLKHLLPKHTRTKHVPLPGEDESVSTDIVMTGNAKEGALVFPAKITTRERIVQPFAHQRILQSVFGEGVYRSVLVCVSEMQRDEESGANEICVPGTIRLFQRHLATLSGIYYLDPPVRYLQKDLTSVVTVASIGQLLTGDLPKLSKGPVTG